MADQNTSQLSPPMAASMVTIPVPRMQGNAAPAVLTPVPSGIRTFLASRGSNKGADGFFGGLMLACALSIIAIVLLIVWVLVMNSRPSLHAFGFGFFVRTAWNPVVGDFGALPFIFGTLVTSFLALCIAV